MDRDLPWRLPSTRARSGTGLPCQYATLERGAAVRRPILDPGREPPAAHPASVRAASTMRARVAARFLPCCFCGFRGGPQSRVSAFRKASEHRWQRAAGLRRRRMRMTSSAACAPAFLGSASMRQPLLVVTAAA